MIMRKKIIQKITFIFFTFLIAGLAISWNTPIRTTKSNQEKKEFVKLTEEPSYLIEGRTVTFNIVYSCLKDRQITLEVSKGSKVIGVQKIDAPLGIDKGIEVQFVSTERIDSGDGYIMKLDLGHLDSDLTETVPVDSKKYQVSMHKFEF